MSAPAVKSKDRAVGVGFVVLANIAFAVGNLVTAGYPSAAGLLAWRGAGCAVVGAATRPTVRRREFFLGAVHAAHMAPFVFAVRSGPAWFAPAALAAVPAVLWVFSGRARRPSVGVAAAVMVIAAVGFFADGSAGIPPATVVLSVMAVTGVAVRLECADRWAGQYAPDGALLVAFVLQCALGVVLGAVTGDGWVLVGVTVAVAVGSSWVGHRALYASAGKTTSTASAAGAPIAVIATAAGAAIWLSEPFPRGLRAVTLLVWLAAAAVIAALSKRTVETVDLDGE
jgi:hypothetical protein